MYDFMPCLLLTAMINLRYGIFYFETNLCTVIWIKRTKEWMI